MWNYLKSDIAELVSVVKEDTTTVFEKVSTEDDGKRPTPARKEATRRMNEEETFAVPLLALPEKIPHTRTEIIDDSVANDGATKDDLASSLDSVKDADVVDDDAWDAADWAEAEEVTTFRASFNIQERTDEIATYLEQYPDTLKVHFETLVPEVVTYEEFWERFFYRCSEERIASEWAAEDERARQARAELVGSVSNFFGVAAKAVVTGVASALHDDERGKSRSNTTSFTTANSNRGALQGLFGTSGRPPFVMNTAVDEDDEDEEEELGWDDDDEDEEDDDNLDERPVTGASLPDESDVEQIVFKDEALDSVTEQLKQAIEERDQLHQTVKLQTKEIISLKDFNEASLKEMEDLRTELKSKATHETLSQDVTHHPADPSSGDDIAKAFAEIQRLVDLVTTKETELSEVKKANEISHENLLQTVDASEKRIELLTQELVAANTDATTTIASVQSELAALTTELTQTKKLLDVSSNEVQRLRTELEEHHQEHAFRHQSNDTSATRQVILPVVVVDSESGTLSADTTIATSSTGVQIDTPSVVVSKMVVAAAAAGPDADDEEGWGDDWD